MRNFCVEFDQNLILEFQVLDHDLALRWYQLLCDVLRSDPSLREDDRLHDFPNSSWTEQLVVDRINACIDTINVQGSLISDRAVVGGGRQQLNVLHKHFENLRGGILNPSTYWQNASQVGRSAVNDLNLQIHRLEDLLDAAETASAWPHMVLTFCNFQRRPLEPQDYALFTTDTQFGEVYINYCEVGKALWNVYYDRDDVIGDHNIRPLRYYSPEMVIKFYDSTQRSELPKFWAWWDENAAHLSDLGFHKDDQDLSIGAIPVARLKTSMDRTELINAISRFDRVNRVYIP
jgi:hypothetical protein